MASIPSSSSSSSSSQNKKILALLVVASSFFCSTVQADESSEEKGVAYDTVLAIVVLELMFAFGVGIVCVVFSLNLVRSMKDAREVLDYLPDGELPPNMRSKLYKTQQAQHQLAQQQQQEQEEIRMSGGSANGGGMSRAMSGGDFRSFQGGSGGSGGGGGGCGLPPYHSFPSADAVSELDSETQQEGAAPPGLFRTFTSYLKFW
jgi:uncharacterized membrane protein YgcG